MVCSLCTPTTSTTIGCYFFCEYSRYMTETSIGPHRPEISSPSSLMAKFHKSSLYNKIGPHMRERSHSLEANSIGSEVLRCEWKNWPIACVDQFRVIYRENSQNLTVIFCLSPVGANVGLIYSDNSQKLEMAFFAYYWCRNRGLICCFSIAWGGKFRAYT